MIPAIGGTYIYEKLWDYFDSDKEEDRAKAINLLYENALFELGVNKDDDF